jgi:steroid delta-isomerase-like uncharacterized protein
MPETETAKPDRKPAKPRRSAKSKAVEIAAREFFEAMATRDPERILERWHDDGVEEVLPAESVFRGKQEIRAFLAGLFASSSNLDVSVDRVVADDSRAVVEWRFRGTFDGSFQGLEPTGRKLDLRGVDILEIEDDKVRRLTAYYDASTFARQVGMLPPQDSGAEKAMKGAFNAVTKVRKAIDERRS